jgi:nitroreductase
MPDDPSIEQPRPSGDPAGPDSSFFAVVLSQRACRRFDDRPVTEDLLRSCLEAAVHAPSAENRQPWQFVVVRDPEVRSAIAGLTRRAWRSGGRRFSEGRLAPALLASVDDGAEVGMATAPVIVVACGDGDLGLEATLPASVYPAVQNLLLAATALGLGSSMTTLATLYAAELGRLLSLPSSVQPMAVVPMGWPERPLGRPRRLPLSMRVHRDHYGAAW